MTPFRYGTEVDVQRLRIPSQMPNLNAIIDAKATRYGKKGASAYSKMKAEWTGVIGLLARSQRFECKSGGHFTYIFHERKRNRDPDNIVSGGVKLVQDGLVAAKLLENDGWEHVKGIRVRWVHNKEFGGVILLVTSKPPTEGQIDEWSKNFE